jgi:parallel beta-helix repeat protein
MQAISTQTVRVGPGIYNSAGGEIFPIQIGQGITLIGAGYDSTIVEGPGGRHDRPGSVFTVELPGIQLKDFYIRTVNSDGVGIWLEGPMTATNIVDNKIVHNYYGIYVSGAGNTRPSIEDNIIRQDSVWIITNSGCQPNIFGNAIDTCFTYGIQIADSSAPNLGQNDTTFAGNNRIFDCGPSLNDLYLVYNESPLTIYAIGNIWEYIDPDPYIYDDDENPDSGPVLTQNP